MVKVKDYYLGIRQPFLSLKDSKDPIMKDYYLSISKESWIAFHIGTQANSP